MSHGRLETYPALERRHGTHNAGSVDQRSLETCGLGTCVLLRPAFCASSNSLQIQVLLMPQVTTRSCSQSKSLDSYPKNAAEELACSVCWPTTKAVPLVPDADLSAHQHFLADLISSWLRRSEFPNMSCPSMGSAECCTGQPDGPFSSRS